MAGINPKFYRPLDFSEGSKPIIKSREQLESTVKVFEEIRIIEQRLVALDMKTRQLSMENPEAALLNECYITGLMEELDLRRKLLAARGIVS